MTIRSIRRNPLPSKAAVLAAAMGGLWLVAFPALADQVLTAQNGATLYAKISATEPNHIEIQSGRIQAWHSASGAFSIDKDPSSGSLYLRPVDRAKPASLFVTTADGTTITLILQPVAIPAQTVILSEPPGRPGGHLSAVEKAGSHEEVIKAMILTMATNDLPQDMSIKELNQPMALWAGTSFTLVREWQGRDIEGQLFMLANTGTAPMRVADQELYQPGVLAVSVENQNLQPGQSTRVFIVRYRQQGGRS